MQLALDGVCALAYHAVVGIQRGKAAKLRYGTHELHVALAAFTIRWTTVLPFQLGLHVPCIA